MELPPPPTVAIAEEWVCMDCGAANTGPFCVGKPAWRKGKVCSSTKAEFGTSTRFGSRRGAPSGSPAD